MVAVQPMVAYLAGIVNHDSALIAFCTLATAMLLFILRSPPRMAQGAWLGGCSGAGAVRQGLRAGAAAGGRRGLPGPVARAPRPAARGAALRGAGRRAGAGAGGLVVRPLAHRVRLDHRRSGVGHHRRGRLPGPRRPAQLDQGVDRPHLPHLLVALHLLRPRPARRRASTSPPSSVPWACSGWPSSARAAGAPCSTASGRWCASCCCWCWWRSPSTCRSSTST